MAKPLLVGAIFFMLLSAGIWFFFFGREFDYTISFTTPHPKGTVYYTLLDHDYAEINVRDQEKVATFTQLEQSGTIDGDDISIVWKITAVNDSATRVTAGIINTRSPLEDRFRLLFRNEQQQRVKEEVVGLKEELKAISEKTKTRIEGETLSPATTCACLSLENSVENKAMEMMRSIDYLSEFVLLHDLKTEGRPRVLVKNWDTGSKLIEFDFCFPLAEIPEFPEDPVIFERYIPSVPSLKVVYNGNYKHSHFAWMELLDYAEANDIQLLKTPLEVFNSNPELGGNAMNWEAEIYMPVKQE